MLINEYLIAKLFSVIRRVFILTNVSSFIRIGGVVESTLWQHFYSFIFEKLSKQLYFNDLSMRSKHGDIQ